MTKPNALFALSLIALALTSCQIGAARVAAQPASQGPGLYQGNTYPVDAIFQEFYDFFGGEAVLGPALTPLIENDGLMSQYVQSGLMLYEATEVENERYRLAPLGAKLGVTEPPVPDLGRPGERYLNGHTIYARFLPLFEQLGGARFVGKPLTEARHNPDKGRIEQYFENLGFYQLDHDQSGEVRLMAYGAFACDQRCRYLAPSASLPRLQPVLPEPFAAQAARLGIDVTGRILAEPHMGKDGRLEVIFENLVMVLEPVEAKDERTSESKTPAEPVEHPTQGEPPDKGSNNSFENRLPLVVSTTLQSIRSAGAGQDGAVWLPVAVSNNPSQPGVLALRPITLELKLAVQTPVPKRQDPVLVFFPVENGLGYHVPRYFYAFLERLGGLKVSGAPVSEVFETGSGVFRQCFTNLCLDFKPAAAENQRLRLAPLGYLYKERFYVQPGEFEKAGSLDGVDLIVWESQAYAGQERGMVIHLAVVEAGRPLANREARVSLTLPDGSLETYRMQPTNSKGQTFLWMPPIQALNGTLIAYQVCLEGLPGEELCVEDHYLVWEYQ